MSENKNQDLPDEDSIEEPTEYNTEEPTGDLQDSSLKDE